MLVSLQLDVDRFSPADRGFAVDAVGADAWAVRQNASNVALVGGGDLGPNYVTLQPLKAFDSAALATFTPSDPDDWEEIASAWMFSGLCLHHRALAATQLRYTAALGYNPATIIGAYFSQPLEDAPISIFFGIDESDDPQIELRLEPGKKPTLYMLDISGAGPTYPTMVFEMTDGPVLTAAALYNQAFNIIVTPLRQRLLIESELFGTWFISPTWQDKPHYSGPPDHYYCIRPGYWAIEATAQFYLSFRLMTYETEGLFEIPFELDYTPTVMPTTDLHWETFSGTGATLSVLQDDGTPYELGDTLGKIRIAMIGSGAATPILNRMIVKWGPTAEFIEGNPVQPDVLRATEILSEDPANDSWEFTIRPGAGETGLWHRPNLPFVVCVDGDTDRMVGLADKPTLQEGGEGANQIYSLKLRSGMKRLDHALMVRGQQNVSEGIAFDGWTISDAVEYLLALAGVDPTEMLVTASAITLPEAEDGQRSLYCFDGGVTVHKAIEQLRDEWASDWLFYHAYDGFHFQAPPSSTPIFTFARGGPGVDPDHVMQDAEVWSDDTEFINRLIVFGQDDNGNVICSDELADEGSVTDIEADDYVGDWREVVVLNSAANTVEVCNAIAAQIWARWNRIPQFGRWKAAFQKTLRPWSIVEIEHPDVPATYITIRLLEMRTDIIPNLSLTDYYGEVVV